MHEITPKVRELSKILWNYQRLNMTIEPADVIIVMGCEDARVAEHAAQLYQDGFAKWIVCTGQSGERTKALLQAKVEIPEQVWDACQQLMALGYSEQAV